MSETKLTVSVIICAYTRERLGDIHEAVASVLSQTRKPGEVIISVDNDERLYDELAESYGNGNQPVPVRVILNTAGKGVSETRNCAIRAAGGDIVAFIDDDAVAAPDWLDNLGRHFQDPVPSRHPVAVGGWVAPLWLNGSRPRWFPEELDWIVGCTCRGLPVERGGIRNVPGCNMAFTRDVFARVGFFRSDIGRTGKASGVAEESELCIRLRKASPGSPILYEPGASIHHKVPSWRLSPVYLIRRSFDEGFFKARIQGLHRPAACPPAEGNSSAPKTLSIEASYLRYLLFTAIPGRLRRFYRRGSFRQIGAIVASIIATGTGYLVGRVRGWGITEKGNGKT